MLSPPSEPVVAVTVRVAPLPVTDVIAVPVSAGAADQGEVGAGHPDHGLGER